MTSPVQASHRVTTAMTLWMVLLTLIWGLSALSAKVITAGIAPIMAAGGRGMLAVLVLLVIALARRQSLRVPAPLLKIVLLTGVLQVADFLFYFAGARFTTSGQLAVFVNTAPLFVAVGAHALLPNDRLHAVKTVGLVLAFAGVVTLFSADLLTQGFGHWRGNLLVLGSSLAWGTTTLIIKRYLGQGISAFNLITLRLTVSSPLLVLISLALERDPFFAVTPLIVALGVFQVFVVVVFSYMMWMWLLQRYPASALQTFSVMSPVWAVVLGVLLLGERLTLPMLAGMAVMGVGLFLVSRPAPAHAMDAPVARQATEGG